MARANHTTVSPIASKFFDFGGNNAPATLKDKIVKSAPLKQKAFGLYGNIYSYPNYGQYRPRFYAQSDTEQGLDALSRELLVRWSRECVAQLPFVETAIRVKAQFAVGNEYKPEYVGLNSAWGKLATDWLSQEFYPNCSTRGAALDFQELMFLESCLMDQDGDFLCIYGRDGTGFPKLQVIPSHRIRSNGTPDSTKGENYAAGPIPGSIISDGVVYNAEGLPLGYNVVNYNNLVNSLVNLTPDRFISARDAQMVYDSGRYADKARGRPAIASAILQALSVQEIDSYLLDKIKLSSMLGYIEKTPSGEGPLEYQATATALNLDAAQFGVFNPSPNVHAVEIVQGVTNKFIKAEGGDIKMLDSNTPTNETAQYVTRLEQQILSVIGVPHQLIYSQESVAGRISDGVAKIFIAGIERQQKLLDRHGKFIISFALANAMKAGLLPENNEENLYRVFNLTHPPTFSLNDGNDHKADLADLAAGVKSLNDITKKSGKTSTQVMEQQEKETVELLTRANRVAKDTNTDVKIVLQLLRENLKQPTPPPQPQGSEE